MKMKIAVVLLALITYTVSKKPTPIPVPPGEVCDPLQPTPCQMPANNCIYIKEVEKNYCIVPNPEICTSDHCCSGEDKCCRLNDNVGWCKKNCPNQTWTKLEFQTCKNGSRRRRFR